MGKIKGRNDRKNIEVDIPKIIMTHIGYAEQTKGEMQEFAYMIYFKGTMLENLIV